MTRIDGLVPEHRWQATTIAHGWQIEEARTRRERARGLLGRQRLAPRHGLWLAARSVHTVGMRFAIDLIWLGRNGSVRRVDRNVVPGRLRTCLSASGGVVEVGVGEGPVLVALLAGSGAARLRPTADRAAVDPHSGRGTAPRPGKGGRAACSPPGNAPQRDRGSSFS